jgi:hypothetical protein
MIDTILVDLLLGVALGLLFAACARPQAREGGALFGRELAALLFFVAAIRWPVAIYLLLVHADWSWLYVVDPAHLGRAALVIVLALDLAAVLGGFWLGFHFARRGRDRALFGALAGAFALPLLLSLVLHHRLGAYASYAEFHAGHSLSLHDVKLGWVLPGLALGTAFAAAAVAWSLWSHGRRARVGASTGRQPALPSDVTPASSEVSLSDPGTGPGIPQS